MHLSSFLRGMQRKGNYPLPLQLIPNNKTKKQHQHQNQRQHQHQNQQQSRGRLPREIDRSTADWTDPPFLLCYSPLEKTPHNATGTVPSARPTLATSGSTSVSRNCCRSATSTWSSACRTHSCR